MSIFTINKKSNKTNARTGEIKTEHGKLLTPFFMPIATHGAVKSLSSFEISNLPSDILLSNTYHLYLRPGIEILLSAGGLHKFMNWEKSILTDSGGYQVFSLAKMRKFDDQQIIFQSHHDGSKHIFTPEKAIDIQRIIGSDIMMMLDICPSGDENLQSWEKAVNITSEWAKRSMEYFNNTKSPYNYSQTIVPIIQGGTNMELRYKSSKELLSLDANIYAIGGLAVGEPKELMLNTTKEMYHLIPENKPRYLMGVGTPSDLVHCVSYGIDMFDCVIPTRNGRNGQLFTFDGTINIKNSKFKNDFSLIGDENFYSLSKHFTKSYLHHLFRNNEILGCRIASLHNLEFYINLMDSIRKSINKNNFSKWANNFLHRYEGSSLF